MQLNKFCFLPLLLKKFVRLGNIAAYDVKGFMYVVLHMSEVPIPLYFSARIKRCS